MDERTLRRVAENKIEAAIRAGEFDNLPGLGKPLALLDEPYDPYWWVRRKLEREQLRVTEVMADSLISPSSRSG